MSQRLQQNHKVNQDKNNQSTQLKMTARCEIYNKRSNHTTKKCCYLRGCQDMVAQKRARAKTTTAQPSWHYLQRVPTTVPVSRTTHMAPLTNYNLVDKYHWKNQFPLWFTSKYPLPLPPNLSTP